MKERSDPTRLQQKLRAAAQRETAPYSADCLEPDLLIDLIEKGAHSPSASQQMLHILSCAYCRHEYEAMERTLEAAGKAKRLQEAAGQQTTSATTVFTPPTDETPARSVAPIPFWRRLLSPSLGLSLGSAMAASLLCYVALRPQLAQLPAMEREKIALQTQKEALRTQLATQQNADTEQKALLQKKLRELQTAQRDNGRLQEENRHLRERRLPPPSQNDPAALASLGALPPPPGGDATGNRGSARQKAAAITLLSPTGTFVAQTRPRLQWRPIAGVTEYTVLVFDSDFNEVVRQKVSGAEGSVAKALTPGQEYSWKVTAQQGEKEITSPSAYFRVLDAKRAAELARDSLNLGRHYAQAGLFEEAERLFRAVPDTVPVYHRIAQNLLKQLQAKRQGKLFRP